MMKSRFSLTALLVLLAACEGPATGDPDDGANLGAESKPAVETLTSKQGVSSRSEDGDPVSKATQGTKGNPEAAAANTGTLLVTVSGMKAGKGKLRVAVFDEANRGGFPEGKYLNGAVVPVTAQKLTVKIPDVEPGKYAIAVFQDLNENGKLDKRIFGIPKEPYGFSGDWKSGAASFDKALFNTADVGFSVSIKLQ